MDPVWIGLCGVVVTVVVAAVHGVRTITKDIELSRKALVEEFERHEEKDELRFNDTIQRLVRLETLVINGGEKPHSYRVHTY